MSISNSTDFVRLTSLLGHFERVEILAGLFCWRESPGIQSLRLLRTWREDGFVSHAEDAKAAKVRVCLSDLAGDIVRKFMNLC